MSDTEKLLPCPFCGHENISINGRQVRFIGQNEFGVKRIKISRYAVCNKCHSRGKPIIFNIVYEKGWVEELRKHDLLAIQEWNRRKNHG